MSDCKEWIQNRAEELAELLGRDYWALPDWERELFFKQATRDYDDREAARIDSAYDAMLEQQGLEQERLVVSTHEAVVGTKQVA